uniref:Capsid protein n=1 Tax=Suncus murinus ribovirus 2 TaxID=3139576 RepID=A0AB38ZKE1_9VIRU
MPYGWTNQVSLAATHQWVEYSSFMNLIRSFRFKQFSLKSHRDEMMVALQNLQTNLPFSATTRFPDSLIYIDTNHSLVGKMLTQLSLALDYSDRQTEKARNVPDQIDMRQQSNMEDAKVSFYNTVRALLDITGSVPVENAHVFGVYIQLSFEREFNLTWTAP